MNQKNQQEQSAPAFTVREGTLGRLELLGLVLVLSNQDPEGKVAYRQLEGLNTGYEGVIPAADVGRISNKPGTAKGGKPGESELEMARRLSGQGERTRQQDGGGQQRPVEEHLYLARKPYGATVKAVYNHATDTLSIRISRTDEKRGLQDVLPTFRFKATNTKAATDRRTRQPIQGKWHETIEFDVVIGDGGEQQERTVEAENE